MNYRNIRVKSTAQWVNFPFSWSGEDGEACSIPAESHLADIARAVGMVPSDFEVIDGTSDQRDGLLLEVPGPSVTPTRQEELLAIGKDAWTDAQQKELIELLASA
jgi:hypothetical protein